MNFRFLDIYSGRKVFFEEQVGTKKYWVFEGLGKYPYVTLISTKVGNKAGGNYGWKTLEDAIDYIKRHVEDAKKLIARKQELREQDKIRAIETFNNIQVGDIYETTWGYEATWYEFYKVVDKKNGYVYLQKLAKMVTDEERKYGYCSEGCVRPILDSVDGTDGEVFKRKVYGYGFGGKKDYESAAYLYNPDKVYEEGNWH